MRRKADNNRRRLCTREHDSNAERTETTALDIRSLLGLPDLTPTEREHLEIRSQMYKLSDHRDAAHPMAKKSRISSSHISVSDRMATQANEKKRMEFLKNPSLMCRGITAHIDLGMLASACRYLDDLRLHQQFYGVDPSIRSQIRYFTALEDFAKCSVSFAESSELEDVIKLCEKAANAAENPKVKEFLSYLEAFRGHYLKARAMTREIEKRCEPLMNVSMKLLPSHIDDKWAWNQLLLAYESLEAIERKIKTKNALIKSEVLYDLATVAFSAQTTFLKNYDTALFFVTEAIGAHDTAKSTLLRGKIFYMLKEYQLAYVDVSTYMAGNRHDVMANAYMQKLEELLAKKDAHSQGPEIPFQILGVSSFSSKKEITAAYRKKCMAIHPDKCPPEQRAEKTEEFKQLKAAYEQLQDATYRENCRVKSMARLDGFVGQSVEGIQDSSEWKDAVDNLLADESDNEGEQNLVLG